MLFSSHLLGIRRFLNYESCLPSQIVSYDDGRVPVISKHIGAGRV